MDALKTPAGWGMALTYRINKRIREYQECGYDAIGIARRKILWAEIGKLQDERKRWQKWRDEEMRKKKNSPDTP